MYSNTSSNNIGSGYGLSIADSGASSSTRLSRKLFGKTPWARNESLDSSLTVTSSVRDVLRGKTPPVTPDVLATNGSDDYPWESSFLGGVSDDR